MLTIRPLTSSDFPAWLPLWDGNNSGKRKEDITTETWTRLIDPNNHQVNGLGAFHKDDMLGLLHYVLHPTTGSIEPICYMQDVYVNQAHRRKGVAKALIVELAQIGTAEHWNRLYWLAEKDNEAAQNLYKTLGVQLDFSLHVWPLGMLKS